MSSQIHCAWPPCLPLRAGKELLLAQRQEEDLKLKRAAEARRLEKLEEQRAREKIRQKLGECGGKEEEGRVYHVE